MPGTHGAGDCMVRERRRKRQAVRILPIAQVIECAQIKNKVLGKHIYFTCILLRMLINC